MKTNLSIKETSLIVFENRKQTRPKCFKLIQFDGFTHSRSFKTETENYSDNQKQFHLIHIRGNNTLPKKTISYPIL